jgi:hypothetical protein
MPYMNNLNLALFPSMTGPHNALMQKTAMNIIFNADKIWEAVGTVWHDLELFTVA